MEITKQRAKIVRVKIRNTELYLKGATVIYRFATRLPELASMPERLNCTYWFFSTPSTLEQDEIHHGPLSSLYAQPFFFGLYTFLPKVSSSTNKAVCSILSLDTLTIILGTVCGVIFLVIVVACIGVCRAHRKKARDTESRVAMPMSTNTTSAPHTTQPGGVQDVLLPAVKPDPDPPPPVGYTADSTSPAISSPGEESIPLYPPPGDLDPWQQSSNSA